MSLSWAEKTGRHLTFYASIYRNKTRSDKICLILLILAILAHLIVMCFLSFRNYSVGRFETFDFAIFDQATYLISRGKTPFVTLRGVHILGDHFSLILYAIAPIRILWISPLLLLILQTLFLGLSSIPIYFFGRHKGEPPPVCLMFATSYLVHPHILGANLFEFHPDTLATPFLAGGFYFLYSDRIKQGFAFLLIASTVKEHIGLLIITFGIYFICSRKLSGIPLFLTGCAIFLISNRFVTLFNSGLPSGYLRLYSDFGTNWNSILINILFRPGIAIARLISLKAFIYYISLLAPMSFIAILAPEILLICTPIILLNLLPNIGVVTNATQHSAPFIPIIYFAAIVGFARWRSFGNQMTTVSLVGSVVIFTLLYLAYGMKTESNTVKLSYNPTLFQLLKKIPANASVSCEMQFTAWLSCRETIFTFPNPIQEFSWGNKGLALLQQQGLEIISVNQNQFEAKLRGCKVEYFLLGGYRVKGRFFQASHNSEYLLYLLKSKYYSLVSVTENGMLFQRNTNDKKVTTKLLSEYLSVSKDTDMDLMYHKYMAY